MLTRATGTRFTRAKHGAKIVLTRTPLLFVQALVCAVIEPSFALFAAFGIDTAFIMARTAPIGAGVCNFECAFTQGIRVRRSHRRCTS